MAAQAAAIARSPTPTGGVSRAEVEIGARRPQGITLNDEVVGGTLLGIQGRSRSSMTGAASPKHTGSSDHHKAYMAMLDRSLLTSAIDNKVIEAVKEVHEKKVRLQEKRWCEDLSLAAAVVGIACMVADIDTVTLGQHRPRDLHLSQLVLRVIVSASTLVLLVLVVQKYRLKARLMVLHGQLPPEATLWGQPHLLRWLLLELVVCGYHIPPGVRGALSIQDVAIDDDEAHQYRYDLGAAALLMWGRCYLLLPLMRNSGTVTPAFIYYCQQVGVQSACDGGGLSLSSFVCRTTLTRSRFRSTSACCLPTNRWSCSARSRSSSQSRRP